MKTYVGEIVIDFRTNTIKHIKNLAFPPGVVLNFRTWILIVYWLVLQYTHVHTYIYSEFFFLENIYFLDYENRPESFVFMSID